MDKIRIKELALDLYHQVFEMVEAEHDATSTDAGIAAAAVEEAFERALGIEQNDAQSNDGKKD